MDGVFLKFHKDLIWNGDNDGEELGYEDVNVVGTYSLAGTDLSLHIDMEKNIILDGFKVEDE